MPGYTFGSFHENGMRQFRSYSGYLDGTQAQFKLSAGMATKSLGQDNGFGGMVTTLCNFSKLQAIDFSGYSEGTSVSFHHYAGKYENGALVPDKSKAYFYIDDPINNANDGYFLITEQPGYSIPTNLFASFF